MIHRPKSGSYTGGLLQANTNAYAHQHQRDQLFGGTVAAPSQVPSHRRPLGSHGGEMPPTSRGGNAQSIGEQTRGIMEDANERAIAELAGKVASMKGLAFDIEAAVQEDRALLDGMGGSFDRVTGMMKGTLGNVQKMLKTGGSKHMCYLVLFVLGLFFVLYWLMSFKSQAPAVEVDVPEE